MNSSTSFTSESYQTTSNNFFQKLQTQDQNKNIYFELSEPFKLNTRIKFTSIKNNSHSLFKFNEPIRLANIQPKQNNLSKQTTNQTQQRINHHVIVVEQAPFSVFKSVKSQEQIQNDKPNNIVVINSNRNHPYNNSIRPADNQSSNTAVTQANEPVPQSRNSSSNAILAHMQSLGPSLKSIFVRPKTSRHVDSSLLLNKATSSKLSQKQTQTFNSLYSHTETSSLLTKLLPHTEPKELRLNQSVDDLLRKFATENDVLSRTIKNISNLSSSSPARSSSPTPSARSTTSSYKSRHQIVDRWTCMVCLSKHTDNVEICSICGSSKPTTNPPKSSLVAPKHLISHELASSKNQNFSSYLLNELGLSNSNLDLSRTSDSSPGLNEQSKSSQEDKRNGFGFNQLKPNPYIKKWTCIHCNYSNDSLKIVCLNCRWVKTSTTRAKVAQQLTDSIRSPSKTHLDKLISRSSSSESNEAEKRLNGEESPAKRTRTLTLTNDTNNNTISVCTSCKPPVDKEQEKPAAITSVGFFANKEAASEHASKWSCSECFASNSATMDKCACCSSSKYKTGADKPDVQKTSDNSLASLFKSKDQGSKWECSSCFIKNDSNAQKCVCCQADKPGGVAESGSEEVSKTLKPFSLPTQATLVLPQTTTFNVSQASTSIKFGLPASTDSSNNAQAKISFGSSDILKNLNPTQASGGFSVSFGKAPETSVSSPSIEPLEKEKDEKDKPSIGFGFSFKPLGTSTTPAITTPFKLGSVSTTPASTPVIDLTKPLETNKPARASTGLFGASNLATTPASTNAPFKFGAISETKPAQPVVTPAATATAAGSIFSSTSQLKPFGSFGQSLQFNTTIPTPTSSATPSPAKSLETTAQTNKTTPMFGTGFGSSFTNTPISTPITTSSTPATTSFFSQPTQSTTTSLFANNKPSNGFFSSNMNTDMNTSANATPSSSAKLEIANPFGANPSSTGFGSSNMFASSTDLNKPLFNAPTSSSFNFVPQSSSMFSSSTTAQAQVPAAASTTTKQPAFSFGASPTTATSSSTTTPQATSFFGSSSGATNPTNPASSSFGSQPFIFGAKSAETRTMDDSTGEPNSKHVTTQPVFKFGETSSTPATGFNFSQSNDLSANLNFNFGQSGTVQFGASGEQSTGANTNFSGRPIRRAMRRNR